VNARRVVVNLGVLMVAGLVAVAIAVVVGNALTSGRAQSPTTSTRPTPRPQSSANPSSVAIGSSGPVAVLVGAGDIGDCTRHEDTLTADLVERIPGIVFTLGDNVYPNGTASDFEDCYAPTWGRPSIKQRTRPAAGGNEYDTPGAKAYFAYFGEAAGDPATGYYAYDAGSWRVYVLNSECRRIGGCGEGSPQVQWLLADLAANARACVLAMWHEPVFTSGPGGGSSSLRHLWRVLYDAGAELILNGDHHVYERFGPQTPTGRRDPDRGVVQIVVGTGGTSPDTFESQAPNSLVQASRVWGVLRLELAPASYAFKFISVAGHDFTDGGAADCH
jgi:acid phosphatase type 7